MRFLSYVVATNDIQIKQRKRQTLSIILLRYSTEDGVINIIPPTSHYGRTFDYVRTTVDFVHLTVTCLDFFLHLLLHAN